MKKLISTILVVLSSACVDGPSDDKGNGVYVYWDSSDCGQGYQAHVFLNPVVTPEGGTSTEESRSPQMASFPCESGEGFLDHEGGYYSLYVDVTNPNNEWQGGSDTEIVFLEGGDFVEVNFPNPIR